MTRIAPQLQDTLDEVVAIDAVPYVDGVLPFHVRYFFGLRSRCRGVSLPTIRRRLRGLEDLGFVERVPGSRPVEWRPTDAGREQATRAGDRG